MPAPRRTKRRRYIRLLLPLRQFQPHRQREDSIASSDTIANAAYVADSDSIADTIADTRHISITVDWHYSPGSIRHDTESRGTQYSR